MQFDLVPLVFLNTVATECAQKGALEHKLELFDALGATEGAEKGAM